MKYFWGDYLDSRFYIADLISRMKVDFILDIGCGGGVLLHFANANFKIGIDGDFNSLKAAQSIYHEFNLIQADVKYLPIKNDFFESILAVQIMAALENKEIRKFVCHEIKRILKPGGRIIIVDLNRKSKHFESTFTKEQKLSYPHYTEMLEHLKDGFEVVLNGYAPFSKLNMTILKRIIYYIPENILENLKIESFLFQRLISEKFLKDGRSYVMVCKKL